MVSFTKACLRLGMLLNRSRPGQTGPWVLRALPLSAQRARAVHLCRSDDSPPRCLYLGLMIRASLYELPPIVRSFVRRNWPSKAGGYSHEALDAVQLFCASGDCLSEPALPHIALFADCKPLVDAINGVAGGGSGVRFWYVWESIYTLYNCFGGGTPPPPMRVGILGCSDRLFACWPLGWPDSSFFVCIRSDSLGALRVAHVSCWCLAAGIFNHLMFWWWDHYAPRTNILL